MRFHNTTRKLPFETENIHIITHIFLYFFLSFIVGELPQPPASIPHSDTAGVIMAPCTKATGAEIIANGPLVPDFDGCDLGI